MHCTYEKDLDDGVRERHFTIGDAPGILWTPPTSPAPLILLGHPGGLGKVYARLVERAQHCAANGFAAATVELPGAGDRGPSARRVAGVTCEEARVKRICLTECASVRSAVGVRDGCTATAAGRRRLGGPDRVERHR